MKPAAALVQLNDLRYLLRAGKKFESEELLLALGNIEQALATETTPPEETMTIAGFCTAENISKSTFFKLKKLGLGPEEQSPPGLSNTVRITARARSEWQERMRQLRDAKEAEKRSERSRDALSKRKWRPSGLTLTLASRV
jgi:hypothetical protein